MTDLHGEKILVGSRTINELRYRFLGKMVRTSRILDKDEYDQWIGDAFWCGQLFDFGGEGFVEFIEQFGGDSFILAVDYGMQWPIDPLTTIEVIDR
jgi:hypothetical protein